ncbi:Immunoglobulin Superfamily Dcc Subclass Member 3 [Manis pentadactyla]|nr:Immunoglobulin Superfamily Dcc Subclass Member 3 [Manis pentadactyla]
MVPSTRCWLPSPPPEFVQWPQFVSMTPGGSTVSTCAAQGVPEPHLVWLKNGKVLSPGDDIRLPPQQQACSLHNLLHTEPAALYEIKLQAFNGHGDGNSSAHVVSLCDVPLATPECKVGCSCSQDASSSLPGAVVGIHVRLAALIICLLCHLLGWRHRASPIILHPLQALPAKNLECGVLNPGCGEIGP